MQVLNPAPLTRPLLHSPLDPLLIDTSTLRLSDSSLSSTPPQTHTDHEYRDTTLKTTSQRSIFLQCYAVNPACSRILHVYPLNPTPSRLTPHASIYASLCFLIITPDLELSLISGISNYIYYYGLSVQR